MVAPLLFLALHGAGGCNAVLFGTIPWLRGGLGIVYFYGFLFLLVITTEGANSARSGWPNLLLDFLGVQVISRSIQGAAQAAYPEAHGESSFAATIIKNPRLFLWNRVDRTVELILSRLYVPEALGMLTGSSKAFEVICVLWMYLALQKDPALDFVEITPLNPRPAYLALTFVGGQRQLSTRRL